MGRSSGIPSRASLRLRRVDYIAHVRQLDTFCRHFIARTKLAVMVQEGRWALAVKTLEDMEASGPTPNEHNWLMAIGA